MCKIWTSIWEVIINVCIYNYNCLFVFMVYLVCSRTHVIKLRIIVSAVDNYFLLCKKEKHSNCKKKQLYFIICLVNLFYFALENLNYCCIYFDHIWGFCKKCTSYNKCLVRRVFFVNSKTFSVTFKSHYSNCEIFKWSIYMNNILC